MTVNPEGQAASAAREVAQIAMDAYIFGFPLVIMDITRAVGTATPKPQGTQAPINQFVHMREFPDASFTYVVAPNADTLYSSAWLDLRAEPMILSVPDTAGRYYLMPMLDGWTNVFAVPGSRTTGNGVGEFAVVGPGWSGTLPDGVHKLCSPTNIVWIIGRTRTDGKPDYPAVHAIQDQYALTPLSAWGHPYHPPADISVDAGIDATTPPVDQVTAMDAVTFFARLNDLMADNPPAGADVAAMARFATIGVGPGKAFDPTALDPVVARGIEAGVRSGLEKIVADAEAPRGNVVNNWSRLGTTDLGCYGTDYLFRASIARIGLGANLVTDAMYPDATADGTGNPLNGTHRYTLHFAADQLPPVNGFWSVTVYNAKGFFVDNPINRYVIGDRDELTYNDDGSLDVYFQHAMPGPDFESNWLPTDAGPFRVSMRMYWPKESALDGSWAPPPITKAD